MATCQHGQKITIFCASQCCQWKEAGGCQSCIKKYHNHMGPTKFIKQSQIHDLVKKYVVQSNIKPKCRTLQQVIYNYFTRLKTELTNGFDLLSKMMINQIGYPYLHQNNQLVPYKRLKNKQYKKLLQKDFRLLVQSTNKRDFKKFLEDETKIYYENIQKIVPLINQLDNLFADFQKLSQKINIGYQHDHMMIKKINQVHKNIKDYKQKQCKGGNLSGNLGKIGNTGNINKQTAFERSNTDKTSNLGRNIAIKITSPDKKMKTQIESLKEQESHKNLISNKSPGIVNRDRLKESHQFPQKKMRQNREISIDKTFKRSRLQRKQKQKQKQRQKEKDVSLSNNSKEIYNNKQQQINEKKQKLINLMKQKQSNKSIGSKNDTTNTNAFGSKNDMISLSSGGKKESLKTEPPALLAPKQSPNRKRQKQLVFTKDKDKKQDVFEIRSAKSRVSEAQKSSMNDLDKSKNSSGRSSDNLKQSPTKDVPHAYLPGVQSRRKIFQDSQQIVRKTYIVPVNTPIDKNQTIEECQSPLIKKKKKMKNLSAFSQTSKEGTIILRDTSKSPTKQESPGKQQKMKIKQNEQKSLALLVKSLGMKAEEAIPHLQSALRHAQNNLSAAQYLSYLLLQIGRPKQCLILCNKMLQKLQNSNQSDQLSLNLNNNKTAALNILGRYSQSIVILQKCLAYKQKDTVYKNLADAYFSIGIYQKAIYNYQKAIDLYQQYDQAHYNLAVCLFVQQNYYNAKLAITRALDYAPKNPAYIELKNHINLRIQVI